MTDVRQTMKRFADMIDAELESTLAGLRSTPPILLEAMRYSVFPGGKRLRPVLALAAADASGDLSAGLAAALAVELIHCCSLVHDDLPCMDDDDFRRGKPSCHRAYGEAMAVLVGDALLTLAFEVLGRAIVTTKDHSEACRLARATAVIATAAGGEGMIGGQALDIDVAAELELAGLDRINRMKTGALIRGAVVAGAVAAGADEALVFALGEYGSQLGRAFQISDDLLDMAADGDRTVGNANPGYPAVIGEQAARELARETATGAVRALGPLGGRGEFLRGLAGLMLDRNS